MDYYNVDMTVETIEGMNPSDVEDKIREALEESDDISEAVTISKIEEVE